MEYAAALLEVLERGDEQSRRLDRSIEWLAIAWRNEEAISLDVRILALRAGFEVLFGGGSSTQKHRAALHSLLDDQTAARRSRTWVDRGKEIHADLTDVEWWFQSFALLRNAIAHGDAISEADRSFEGQLHLWRGEHTLRAAIKRTVVQVGHDPDLELDRATRELRRALADAVEPEGA